MISVVPMMPEEEENEFAGSFLTHANWLRAFSMLCRAPYTAKLLLEVPDWERDLPALKRRVEAIDHLDASGLPQPSEELTEKSLRSAWGTELLLALSGTVGADDELFRLMNNWAVVQSYYCCYHATQALIAARGERQPENHQKLQGQFVNLWITPRLSLPPWSFGAGKDGWCNLPAGLEIDETISNWKVPDRFNSWSLAAKSLRTTRQAKIDERLRAARETKRKRNKKRFADEEEERRLQGRRARKEPSFPLPLLNTAAKKTTADKVRAYSMIDYLYRLRIKTNYEEPRMFTDGPKDRDASLFVYGAIVSLTEATMLVHELRIQRLVGAKRLAGWADRWLAGSGPAAEGLALSRRRDLLV